MSSSSEGHRASRRSVEGDRTAGHGVQRENSQLQTDRLEGLRFIERNMAKRREKIQ